jgi:hypothetical protein
LFFPDCRSRRVASRGWSAPTARDGHPDGWSAALALSRAGRPFKPTRTHLSERAFIATGAPSSISTLLVEGDNRQGLGHAIAKAIGDAEINMSFVMVQVVGRRYSAVFGFENDADASKAATLIKRATACGKN